MTVRHERGQPEAVASCGAAAWRCSLNTVRHREAQSTSVFELPLDRALPGVFLRSRFRALVLFVLAAEYSIAVVALALASLALMFSGLFGQKRWDPAGLVRDSPSASTYTD